MCVDEPINERDRGVFFDVDLHGWVVTLSGIQQQRDRDVVAINPIRTNPSISPRRLARSEFGNDVTRVASDDLACGREAPFVPIDERESQCGLELGELRGNGRLRRAELSAARENDAGFSTARRTRSCPSLMAPGLCTESLPWGFHCRPFTTIWLYDKYIIDHAEVPMTTRIEIADVLRDRLDGPLRSKAELLEAARALGARAVVVEALERLPERKYGGLRDLWPCLPGIPIEP